MRLRMKLPAPVVKAFSTSGALVAVLSVNDSRFGG
jgi:hypothetical protein